MFDVASASAATVVKWMHVEPDPKSVAVSCNTLLVEPTGVKTHVIFDLAGHRVMAVVDGEQLVRRNSLFAADTNHERVHVFDRATGLRCKLVFIGACARESAQITSLVNAEIMLTCSQVREHGG